MSDGAGAEDNVKALERVRRLFVEEKADVDLIDKLLDREKIRAYDYERMPKFSGDYRDR